jgi:hypothetical protein
MRAPRQRRYVHPYALGLLRAVLRYSATRDAYVLHIIGGRFGPVVRVDRRAAQMPFDGPDRRHAGHGQAASRA